MKKLVELPPRTYDLFFWFYNPLEVNRHASSTLFRNFKFQETVFFLVWFGIFMQADSKFPLVYIFRAFLEGSLHIQKIDKVENVLDVFFV